jgi:ubiquitin-conjugating enzyme E2 D/E
MSDNDYEMDEEELNGIMEYEYKHVKDSEDLKNYGFRVENEKEGDYKTWKILMTAPDDSDYKGGKYLIKVEFQLDYPLENPKFTFITPIYHCNVKQNGELNVNWLMKGMKIDYIMPRLLTLFYLQDPSVDENSEISKLYKDESKKDEFKRNIEKNAQEAKGEL